MKNNPEEKLDALFAAARAEELDTSRLEYGFETRVAARLREENGALRFALAWRLCPYFAALALAIGWWSHESRLAESAVQIVAEETGAGEDQLLAAYLTGARP